MSRRRSAFAGYLIILVTVVCLVILGVDRLQNIPTMRFVANQLFGWTLLLSAFGLLAGIFNLFWVHLVRIANGHDDWAMSLILIAVLLGVFSIGMVEANGAFGPLMQWTFSYILAPVQSSLFALLAFFLAVAGYRYLRIGRNGSSWMLAGALLMLLVQMPLTAELLSDSVFAATYWLLQAPITAAMRGVLLGSTLAALVVGIYLLFKG